MSSPFNIGYQLFVDGKGISDLWGAVKHDSDLEEAHRGYMTALNDSSIPILTDTVMDENNNEVMDILQEECAEVIQAVSKIRRFGMDNSKYDTNYTNREHLEEELGDMLAMIDILMVNNIVSWSNLHQAKRAKIEKLKKWSKITNLDKI
jgi:NTP pyrophosphatase (non-canonical NTP hydrolase)